MTEFQSLASPPYPCPAMLVSAVSPFPLFRTLLREAFLCTQLFHAIFV